MVYVLYTVTFAMITHAYFFFDSDKYITKEGGEVLKVPTKITQTYVPFSEALEHNWSKTTPRIMKKISPGLWNILSAFKLLVDFRYRSLISSVDAISFSCFSFLALFATQIAFPSQPLTSESLSATATTLLPSIGATKISPPSLETLSYVILPNSSTLHPPFTNSILFFQSRRIARTSIFEFPASAAIVGGIVGQDILNALGGKEEPVRNLMVFEGETGAGNVWALGL